eukprot:gb/GEZN01004127.1/.p1 GENE.gb/GEZN01004127.1/~~gb/GEZN01004127.1/.p1  ORF type:complete len:151 (-),score=31.01 gb/GEZN01004127.1/:279-731(-)
MADANLRKWKDAFSVMDKKCIGKVSNDDLPVLLRGLREFPTEAEIASYIAAEGKDGSVSFPSVVNIMNERQVKIKENPDELKESFKVFDKDGQGTCSTAELRHVLTSLGEKLTRQEMDALVKLAEGNEEGQLNYEGLMRTFESNFKYNAL